MQRLRAEIASDLQIFASRVEVLTSLPYLSDAGRPTLAEAAVALAARDAVAKARRVMLMPAVGFDVVPVK